MEDEKVIVTCVSGDKGVSSPYSIFSSDNHGALITSVQLKSDNYNEWATEMMNALQAKRKTGFIYGTFKKPPEGHANLEAWLSVNSMIVGWLRTSIEPRVRSTVTQDGQAVIDYYGRLANMWKELQTYRPPSAFHVGHVVTAIIEADVLPDIGKVYNKNVHEEYRLNSAKIREQQQEAVGFTTRRDNGDLSVGRGGSHDDFTSQVFRTKDNIELLIGYPKWFTERRGRGTCGTSRGGGGRGNSSSLGRGQSNAAFATISNPVGSTPPELTPEQWRAITQIINNKSNSSDKLSGKDTGDVIIDTCTSHHMMGDINLLIDLEDISPCKVGFVDGSTTVSNKVGVLPLSDRISLYDVLYVPYLNCSLISDRCSRMLIGAGEERDGCTMLRMSELMLIKFWREDDLAAAHVINITPTKVLTGKYAHKLLFVPVPSYSDLQLYDSEKNEFLVSRDVIFKENEFSFSNSSSEEDKRHKFQVLSMSLKTAIIEIGPKVGGKRTADTPAVVNPDNAAETEVALGSLICFIPTKDMFTFLLNTGSLDVVYVFVIATTIEHRSYDIKPSVIVIIISPLITLNFESPSLSLWIFSNCRGVSNTIRL
ncbi:uncharacterized protein LOC103836034 [Brassica rapa]|uniref:uncharacterized protein LOC103836034 n=1 Tax=Brassica campestris TaxID=3711 RepID=UPI0004F1C03F|nr:uncharacterized protein LOC103836034 [Brassica rapa]